jgi:arylsulfatase A-like enzyme/Flp pilus assembly protein TadD
MLIWWGVRRIQLISAIGLMLAAGFCEAAEQPNIVLITIDTLRADHLHSYGYQQIRTPHIDRLAVEGARFTTVMTAAPLTLPAHSSIMTGAYPMFHGVRDNVGYRLNPGTETLAQILKQHGYETGAFVGAYVLDRAFGLGTGFDFYYDHFEDQTNPAGTINLATLKRPGKEVVDQALAWLQATTRKASGHPFFVWVHLYDPHDPYDPPAPFKAEYSGNPYDGEIAYADQQVGRLLTFLSSAGLYDKTLIALTGDHGESLGEHKEVRHGYFVYDATILVPWILKPSNRLARPRVVTETVRSIDIAPTILQIAGYPKGKTMQGEGLADLISGKARDVPPDAYSESFYPLQFGWSALRTLRSANFKYIDAPHPELYELDVDPHELKNRAAQRPAVISELRAKLQALDRASSAPDVQSKAVHVLAPEEIEKLAKLGYLANSVTQTAGPAPAGPLADPKDTVDIFYAINSAGVDASAGKCDRAIAALTGVISRAPGVPMAYLMLGRCYFTGERFEEAKKTFHDLLKVDPQNTDAAFYVAASAYHLDSLDEAEAGMKQILAANPRRTYAHKYLGFVYQAQGKVSEAIGEFTVVLQTLPNDLESHGKLGFLLAGTGRLPEALPHFEKVVALAPSDASAHFNLGVAFEQLRDGARAKAEFDLACKLDKTQCNK